MELENNLEKAEVLILGTYHFGEAGEYAVNVDISDVLSNEKQQEIIEVVDKIIKFKPNKIAVEQPISSEKALNEFYMQYCSGRSL